MAPPQQHHAFDSLPPPKDKAHETVPLADHVFNSIFDAQCKVLDPKAKAFGITKTLDLEAADKQCETMRKFNGSALAVAAMDRPPLDDAARRGAAAGDRLINNVIKPEVVKPEVAAEVSKPIELVSNQTQAQLPPPWSTQRDYSAEYRPAVAA